MSTELKNLLNEYRNWILPQIQNPKSEQMSSGGEIITFEKKYALGQIKFHELTFNGEDIVVVELLLTNPATEDNEFYLHFELKDLPRAKELFQDMLDVLNDLKSRQTKKILLSCTSALTTSYFKEKLNDAAKLLGVDFEFDAVSFPNLYKVGFNYSMILLAPQIAYEFQNVSQVLHDQIVMKVPPKIFARYDVTQMIELIRQEFEDRKKSKAERKIFKAVGEIKTDKRILSIAVMPIGKSARIAYRMYEHGEPIFSETIIKGELNLFRDLQDILETVSFLHGSITYDAVGIATAGSVHDGCIDLPKYIDSRINLKDMLEDDCGVPVVITNNLRSAVTGFYSQQDKYKDIMFCSLPRGFRLGGLGILLDGKVVSGAHNISGEIHYIDERNLDGKYNFLDPDEVLQVVAQEVLYGITVVDPEVVCVRNELNPDMEKLRAELLKKIHAKYIPELVHISEAEFQELILLGQMMLTLKEIEK